ncbi:hypothetical protein A5658_25980 [Mycobacterium sp. 1245111.1]|nr:hypothetical protein A5658_25980 [Mycobacterium sp. 1245111.1]
MLAALAYVDGAAAVNRVVKADGVTCSAAAVVQPGDTDTQLITYRFTVLEGHRTHHDVWHITGTAALCCRMRKIAMSWPGEEWVSGGGLADRRARVGVLLGPNQSPDASSETTDW